MPDIGLSDGESIPLLLKKYYKPWKVDLIKAAENTWQHAPSEPGSKLSDQGSFVAYIQLILAHESLLQESRGHRIQGTVNNCRVARFQEKALKLGFLTPTYSTKPNNERW